jgi:hypothetical protein
MTKLEKENLELKKKLKEGRKRWREKADEHISKMLSRWGILLGGGAFCIGALAEKLTK